jgi:hypothetical protein
MQFKGNLGPRVTVVMAVARSDPGTDVGLKVKIFILMPTSMSK